MKENLSRAHKIKSDKKTSNISAKLLIGVDKTTTKCYYSKGAFHLESDYSRIHFEIGLQRKSKTSIQQ